MKKKSILTLLKTAQPDVLTCLGLPFFFFFSFLVKKLFEVFVSMGNFFFVLFFTSHRKFLCSE